MFSGVTSRVVEFSPPTSQNEEMNNCTAMALEESEALPVGEQLRGARPAFGLQDPSCISKTTCRLHECCRILTLPSDAKFSEWRQDHFIFLTTGVIHLVKLLAGLILLAILALLTGMEAKLVTNQWATVTMTVVVLTLQVFICVPCWQLYRAVKKGELATQFGSMLVVCLVLSDHFGTLALFLSRWYQHPNSVYTNAFVMLQLVFLLAECCLPLVHRVSLVFVICGSGVLVDCLSNDLNDGVSFLFRLFPLVVSGAVCLAVVYLSSRTEHQKFQLHQLLRQQLADCQAARDEAQVARGEAENALKNQASFFARMSHEIRTPLHGVLGLIEILSKTPLTNTQKTLVENSMLAGRSLSAIVNDILDLEKMRAGKFELDMTGVQIRLLPQGCMTVFTAQIQQKSLTFDLNVDEDIPDVVVGDSIRVLQVLTNLTSNAIKFTDVAGSVWVVSGT